MYKSKCLYTRLSILANFSDNIVSGIHAALIARINRGQIIVFGNEITFEAKTQEV